MARSHLILTDSGGVQEEAPALGKPVLVFRTTTERPEVIENGAARLIGIEVDSLLKAFADLHDASSPAYLKMMQAGSPYGDGLATQRVMEAMETYFNIKIMSQIENKREILAA